MSLWTQPEEERLVQLLETHKDNKKFTSFNLVHHFHGKTRSAIMGKVRRMGLKMPLVKGEKTRSKEKNMKPNKVIKYQDTKLFINETPNMTTYFLVKDGQCRWPIIKGISKQWCCGHPADGVYCDYHAQNAYAKRPQKA